MKALVRADASVGIGMGHRVRCQALIAALQALGWDCQFVVHRACATFAQPEDQLIDTEQEFLQQAATVDLVILDHYQYQAADIARLYQYQANLLVLDDMNERGAFPARWVLNPLHEEYSPQVQTSLTGPQFALLRAEFQSKPQASHFPEKLLLTLGGTDPLMLTLGILKSLQRRHFPLEKILVLCGKNALNSEAVKAFSERHKIDFKQGLSEVSPVMKEAKLAISAAGGTLFELAAMGVPSIFAQVADNQTRSLQQHVPLGWCQAVRFDHLPVTQRASQIDALVEQALLAWSDTPWLQASKLVAQSLVDGQGAARVALIIHEALAKPGNG
ncbi:PseG/SpsG family protein [Marinomonas pollencensis]|uniref:Spore coat polysaccharide biosynthesis predicted glycosyltransferase SpsG n=1 Tax=Marinomonas pollencensis TaxID=491954 RepID=A0A3E0DR75_9GAMM|nr:glycosyltransferase [Marinomonas pollencensis]REG84842.1 spore coat polysaccharide biosynthesis predicted glycosyltransferase SpsG [Marinomonas pollencensis]